MARARGPRPEAAPRLVADDMLVIPAELLPWGADGQKLPLDERFRRDEVLDRWLVTHGRGDCVGPTRGNRKRRSELLHQSRALLDLPPELDPRLTLIDERTT